MTGARYTTTEMLARLVGFDTTSRGSNLALIEFAAEYLRGHGIEPTLTYDDAGAKANLFATLGPAGAGGVVLSGHTDVVPVDGQPWTTDPFTLVESEGRLYGRGTCDMKGFLAVALALVPELLAAGLAKPIHLALSYDEEVGCLGVPRLIEGIRAAGLAPAIVIVGEPSGMRVVNAHKGVYGFVTTVTGHEAHSSATHIGVNAILVGGRLIAFLADLADERKRRAAPQRGFVPPYTTVHVGTVEGGTAANIVPRLCRFAWEYRLLPGEDADEIPNRFATYVKELEPAMKKIAPDCGIETRGGARVPGLEPEPGGEAEALALALTGDNRAGVVSYGTEAGLFQRAGMSVVICGPGDIAQAHKPDEFVETAQIEACARFVRRLGERLSGRG